MKTYTHIFVILALFLVFSCTDQEDFEPQKLIGTWENTFYFENLDLDQVEVYYFGNNGKYTRYTGFRAAGSSSFLGYTMYLEGSYVLSGRQILLKEESRLVHLGEEAYGQLEGLSEIEQIAETPASLAFKDNGSILEITTTCSDLLSSYCIPVTSYNRLKTISHF